MAGRGSRWAVAALVTGGVLAAVTWASGALVLPLWIKDSGNRWVIATAAGLALSGLAALWGKSYATARQDESPPRAVAASGSRSVAVGGDLSGSVTTGDRTRVENHAASSPGNSPTQASPSGGVTASGERSIAIGGSVTGTASTGDAASVPGR